MSHLLYDTRHVVLVSPPKENPMYLLRLFFTCCISLIVGGAASQTPLTMGEWEQTTPLEWRRDVVEREHTVKLIAQIFVTIVANTVLMRHVIPCAPHEAAKTSVHIWEAGAHTGTGKDCDGDDSIIILNPAVHSKLIDTLPEPAAQVYRRAQTNKMRARNDYT